MGKIFETQLNYVAPFNKVYIAMYQALKGLDMEIRFEDPKKGQLWAHNSHSYSTDGEDISINVMPQPTGCLVYLCSRCTSSQQLFDFGKNKKNVNKIIEAAAPYL